MRRPIGLRASREQLEDADARELVAGLTATPISAVRPRQEVTVAGAVVSLTYPPVDAPVSLTARLDDGTGTISLIFMGRRDIPGIHPGRLMVARGRAAEMAGQIVMHNPTYELVTGADE